MKQQKILLIIEGLNSGGAERQICGLASLLSKRGYDCRLIYYNDVHFYEPYLKNQSVNYEYCPDLLNKYTRVIRLVKYLYQYKPTTVIAYLPMVTKTCCLARMFYKCNLIVSERNNNVSVTKGDKIQFNLYRLANYVVPNSHSQGEFIKKNFPFLSNKVCPIINFVDVNHFIPVPQTNTTTDNDVCRIVTAARYTKQKNCLKYLESIAILKKKDVKVHFDWYGSKKNDPKYYQSVEARAKELNILDYVSLNDTTSRIVEEYQKADAFLLPSLFEGYPNVVAEAMCCELPILCSRVFENPYIIEEGINGFLFDPEDVEDIVRSIQKVVSLSQEERKRMGSRNRKLCLSRNTEEVFLKSYIKLIDCQ